MGKEQVSRIEFDIMDSATHVSASALEPNEPAHNTLPFPPARICMHATSASEDRSAPNAMAYSMACCMAHAGHSRCRNAAATATATATAQQACSISSDSSAATAAAAA